MSVAQWENTLGALVVGDPRDDSLSPELASDPGIGILRKLVGESRAGMIVDSLKLSSRLLLLAQGEDGFRHLLREFWRQNPPQLFASLEGERFIRFIEGVRLDVRFLDEILAFEGALIAARTRGEARTVRFTHDPAELLAALAEGRLPEHPSIGDYDVRVDVPPAPTRIEDPGVR